MTTLPPPGVIPFPEDSLEKKVYKIVDNLQEFLPIPNDRNRLGFCLFKYMTGEGDEPEVLLKTQKLTIQNISKKDLADRLSSALKEIQK